MSREPPRPLEDPALKAGFKNELVSVVVNRINCEPKNRQSSRGFVSSSGRERSLVRQICRGWRQECFGQVDARDVPSPRRMGPWKYRNAGEFEPSSTIFKIVVGKSRTVGRHSLN